MDRPATPGAIPSLPTFNAGAMMRTQVAYVGFQNGTGMRFPILYGRAYRPINKHELFYTFRGLTEDGAYHGRRSCRSRTRGSLPTELRFPAMISRHSRRTSRPMLPRSKGNSMPRT